MVMMVAIAVDVAGRYLFGNPLPGGVELNRSLLVVAVFGGVSYTQLRKAHITVDVVVARVSTRLRLILERFGLLIALVVYAFMTYTTIPVTYHSIIIREFETGLIPFPMWPARLATSIGLFILTLQLVADSKAKLRHSSERNSMKATN